MTRLTRTGARSRGELVGQVFLEHYVSRWEDLGHAPSGWMGKDVAPVKPASSGG